MINLDQLITKSREVLKNSYSIYSNFRVGAALQTKDGNIIVGTNIENASYGLCNCAERTALFTAYTMGYRKDDIIAFAVTTDVDHMVSPCGACRQVMSELLNENTPVFVVYGKDEIKTFTTSVKELLPYSFGEKDLNV